MVVVPLHPEFNGVARGDVDCDDDVDAVDALQGLRYVAGLNIPACVFVADADCDADIDAVDALQVLRTAAALPVNLPAGCPEIGSA